MTKSWNRQKKYYYKNKDKISQRRKEYYQKNKEKLNTASKRWQHKHREHVRNYNRDYNKKHPEIAVLSDKKRITALRQILRNLKINGCAKCGYNSCYRALHFHHINPEDKLFRITIHGLKFDDNKIVNELNKCMLLCANCHSEITAKEVGDYNDC
jgi:exonuclease VII large subunit